MDDAFGSSSSAFGEIVMQDLELILRPRGSANSASDRRLNYALAALGAVEPRNELEAMLGAQIVAAHTMSMEWMGRAQHAGTLAQSEAYCTMATKASRTMVSHVEALTKLRTGGQQRITVKHVHVHGDAVVGDHNQTVFGGVEGAGARNLGQPREPGIPALPGAAVWGEDAFGLAMPSAGIARQEALQASRGHEPRRAEGAGERPLPDRPLDERDAGGEG
jgi:hypothetical protein